ncbi:MAG: alpha-amylase family glycosyl hydrolase [Cetobacterium sp.]|uniref:alpha-amylase family glycosyl hydrolase n=1 Tax=Cetobacterium sp. TaxID=2071632 RepID=UPI003F342065
MLQKLINKQRKIDEKFSTTEELGANYSSGVTKFTLWAPTAKKVFLLIFDKENKSKLIQKISMKKSKNGIWSYIEEKIDLDGYFYQYEVDSRVVFDTYSKSMASFRVSPEGKSIDGEEVAKGAIIDLSKTVEVIPLEKDEEIKREDCIIYEVNIRDFTSEEGLETRNPKGSYKAFIEKLDYIKELGVTHVQLLPVMKFFYNDEENKEMEYIWSSKNNNYNWGYDPYSYFSPEGVYSSDSRNPYARINELKEVINEIHKRGLGVVLDVVYTHMADKNLLDSIVPNYYFFFGENGEYVGGFGNNLATTQNMAKRIILDSIKYWFEEYKIDGLRFDMMGDADKETIQEAYEIAKNINKNTIFIGEGWKTFKGHSYGTEGADQNWSKESNAVGMFSDDFRNILKSGYMKEGKPKFLSNGKICIRKLFKNIKAQPTNFLPYSPGSVVQYIEAHDNATLHDTIAMAMRYKTKTNQEDIHKRIRLGNFLLLTSQGTSFIHCGQEVGRSKEWLAKELPEQKYIKNDFGTFIDDSYDSTDYVNSFKWSNLEKNENQKTLEFTKSLISLRKSEPKFRYKSFEEIDRHLKLIGNKDIKKDLFIAYKNQNYIVIVNADKKDRELNIDLNRYVVVVDGDRVNISGIEDYKNILSLKDGIVKIKALNSILLRERKVNE